MSRFFLLCLVTWCCVCEVAAESLTKQQQLFLQAEKLVGKPNSKKYLALKKQLKNYPLLPYLEQKALMRFPFLANRKRIERMLEKYANTPLARPLRKKWLISLSKEKNAEQAFLANYKDLGDAKLTCHHLHLLYQQQGITDELLNAIQRLWLVGKSQPRQCDRLFKIWRDAGRQTSDVIWKRIALAAKGGSVSLIPYLKKQLPQDQAELAELWRKIRLSPKRVSRLDRFSGKFKQKEAQIVFYGLDRLIWRDPDLALTTYQKAQQRFKFSAAQQQLLSHTFALALASKGHEKATFWLEQATNHKPDKAIYRWHLAHLVRQSDWQEILNLVDSAPEFMTHDGAFQYWSAKALQANGKPELARGKYTKLAGERSYYGFMASGHLAQQPKLQNAPLNYTDAQLAAIAARPAAQRAYELFKLGRLWPARQEWRFLKKKLSAAERLVAAVLTDSWGWHDQTIFGFAQAGYMNDVERRFPLAYTSEVAKQAKRNKIDPAWTMAIVRRESSFMPDARSSAGARGLMQLMPGTAQYLSKKKLKKRYLYNPGKNLGLGTRYMRYLMDKMDGNSVLATASYNAGWRRVKQWLPQQGEVPMDVWVETIPYKETRNYVKAVMAYRQIYAQRMNQSGNLFNDLVTMQIRANSIQ